MATEKNTWNDADAGWNEVEAEDQIVLENEGDGFIGRLEGMDETPSGIKQIHLTNVTTLEGDELGKSMFMNAGRDLINKLAKVPAKSTIRVQWTSSLDTGQASPMRVFSVQYR